ncbi:MAG: hypothetical protein IPF54_17955 [Draconibacterium sp.]|nr:hypothetical protein [Draconibacterium sp.]
MPDNYALDIKSQFLLKSEIKEKLNNLATTFIQTTRRGKVLDLLMMTQGWRRFVWNDT